MSRKNNIVQLFSGVTALGIGLTSQGISSFTNFGLTLILARHGTPTQFGAAALALLFYSSGLAFMDAAMNQPLMLLIRTAKLPDQKLLTAQGFSLAVVLALSCGIIVWLITLMPISHEFDLYIELLAPVLPLLLLHEWQRQLFFTELRPWGALWLDLGWITFFFSLVGLMSVVGRVTALGVFVMWEMSGSVVAISGLLLRRFRPNLRHLRPFWIESFPISRNFLTEAVVGNLSAPLMMSTISAELGLSATGGIRGAQTLLSPISTFNRGMSYIIYPRLVSSISSNRRRFSKLFYGYWIGTLIGTSVMCGIVLAIPTGLGRDLLGQTWPIAETVLPALCLYYIASAFTIGLEIRLQLPRPTKFFAIARIQDSIFLIVLSVLGAVFFGISGAAYGMAISRLAAAPGWYFCAHIGSAMRQREPN